MSDRVERILAAIAALAEEERARLFERLASEMGFPPSPRAAVQWRLGADKVEGRADYVIVFDGGSRGNPGPGYGSYALVREHEGKQSLVRLDFGRQMTNNEAEYETLIAGLQGLIERIEAAGEAPADLSVEVRGDSALVFCQVDGTWKARDERMRALRNRVREILARFKGHRLVHQPREETVRVLGH